MGEPKKLRKTYYGPSHPWQKTRIDEEILLTRDHGFKNKAEIWKMSSLLSGFKRQAKRLAALQSEQAKKETRQLFDRLASLGLLKDESYDAVLEISLKDVIDRRLQSVLVTRGLARTPKQARQFITHNHVMVGEKVISSPSYLVKKSQEMQVAFSPSSNLASEDHPERGIKQEIEELEKEVAATKEDVPTLNADAVSEDTTAKPKAKAKDAEASTEKKDE